MSGGRDNDGADRARPHLSLGQRLLAALPRLRRDGEKVGLVDRFKEAVVKPVESSASSKAKAEDVALSVEELREIVDHADDKERLTGLLLAPVGAAIGLLVSGIKISSAQAARLANGQINPQHHNLSIYELLELEFVVLAILMMAAAFYRKRLFLGIVMALYGLSLFNLPPYWGFGIPYILAGAWLLVRTYRFQRDLKEATGEEGGSQRQRAQGRRPTNTTRPSPNKRYTPPTPSRRTQPKSSNPNSGDQKKSGDEKKAG